MNIINGLQKIAEETSRCLQHFIIAKIGEKSYEAFPKEIHEIIEWFAAKFPTVGKKRKQMPIKMKCLNVNEIKCAMWYIKGCKGSKLDGCLFLSVSGELKCWLASSYIRNGRKSFSQVRHQRVRIDLMCVEHSVFASCRSKCLFPHVVAKLLLHNEIQNN